MDPVVFGRYTLLHRIARGGMAELYLARSEGVGIARLIVIKVVSGRFSEDPSFTTMFEDEVRIASTLNHPNIGQVIDVGQVGGTYYLAMEHIHGMDVRAILKRCLKRGRTVPTEIAAQIGCKVCSALQHAHGVRGDDGKPLGIIHRDVSPSNVMVSFDGQVKLIDFGIAKAENRVTLTMPGTIKGKLRYLSPEQVLAQGIDARSDLFTLGVTLWEATVGEHLFDREQEVQIYEAIVKGEVRRPGEVVPGYSPGFERILMTALASKPEDRFANAREMQLALEQYLAEEKIALSEIALSSFMQETFAEELAIWQQAQGAGGGLVEYLKRMIPDDGSRPAVLPDEGSDRSDSSRAAAALAAPSPAPEVGSAPRKTILYGEFMAPGALAQSLLRPIAPTPTAELRGGARPPTGPPRQPVAVVTRDGQLRTGPLPQLDSDPGGRRPTMIVDDARPTIISGLPSPLVPEPAPPRQVLIDPRGLVASPSNVERVTGEGRPTMIASASLEDEVERATIGDLPSAMIVPIVTSPGPGPVPVPIEPSTLTGPLPMPLPEPIVPKLSPDAAPEPVIGRDRLDLEEKKRAARSAAEEPRPISRTGDWAHQHTGEVRAGTHPYFHESVVPTLRPGDAKRSHAGWIFAVILVLVAGGGVGAWFLVKRSGGGVPVAPADAGATPALRKVELQSDPSGASVRVPATGKSLGKTPLLLELKPGETIAIEIELAGHQRQSLMLQADTGRRKVYLVPEPQAEPRPDPRPEPKPEPKAPTTLPTPEPKPDPKLTPAPEPKPDPKLTPTPEPKPKPKLRPPRRKPEPKKAEPKKAEPKPRRPPDILDPFQ